MKVSVGRGCAPSHPYLGGGGGVICKYSIINVRTIRNFILFINLWTSLHCISYT